LEHLVEKFHWKGERGGKGEMDKSENRVIGGTERCRHMEIE
jgi:hypothetical protein